MKTLDNGKLPLHACPYCGGKAFLSKHDIENMADRIKDEMWNHLKTGTYEWTAEDTQTMRNLTNMICTMLSQKTAGQDGYAKPGDIDFDHFTPIVYRLAMQAVALCLSDAVNALNERKE